MQVQVKSTRSNEGTVTIIIFTLSTSIKTLLQLQIIGGLTSVIIHIY